MYAFEEPFGPSQTVAKRKSHLIFQGNYDSCISPKLKEQSEVLGISDTLVSCTFASLETKRNVACVNFPKYFWDGFWVQRKNWPIAERRVIRNNFQKSLRKLSGPSLFLVSKVLPQF